MELFRLPFLRNANEIQSLSSSLQRIPDSATDSMVTELRTRAYRVKE